MVATPITLGKPLGPEKHKNKITSQSATFVGSCSPDSPFTFPLTGESGVGAIGMDAGVDLLDIEFKVPQDLAILEMTGEAASNFFALESTTMFKDVTGWRFEYMDAESGAVVVACSDETDIIVLVKDDSNLEVEASLEPTSTGQILSLSNGLVAKKTLQGKAPEKKGQGASPINFGQANKHGIMIEHEPGSSKRGLAIVNAVVPSGKGKDVIRSFIVESSKPSSSQQKIRDVNFKCCNVNDDGDVEVEFPSLSKPGESLRVDIRVGLSIEGQELPSSVVDVAAFLEGNGMVTVHRGWLSLALEEHGLQNTGDGWDVFVQDLIVTDPEAGHEVVGLMGKPNGRSNSIPSSQKNKKKKVSQTPLEEERGISKDMQAGRKPQAETRRLRSLSTAHKKILVHGYCADSNPFPENQFTDYAVFEDPAAPASWSHDTFAQKIASFANANGITGCGIIAHSQGGAAALHLYTYYWSCLDYSTSGDRMIQSVGTPYQGTMLAGSLAALGGIFGVGCGTNNDLTYSGASAWLSGIPTWARSQVHYYTTSFTDKWWRYDYCHLGSDILLGDPEDGTTEKSKGQLPYGNNRGHKTGQCHTTGMRDLAQSHDGSRNGEMNAYAKK